MVDCLYNCHCKELSAGDRIGIPYLKIGISVLGRNPTQTKGKLSRLKVAIGVKAANYCLMNYQVKFKPKAIKDLESLPLVEVKKMLGLQRVYEINTFILVRVGGLCLCSRDFNRLDIFSYILTRSGSRTVKVEPRSTSLSTAISPPKIWHNR